MMKLLAFLRLFPIFTTQRPDHGAVVVLVQQHGADSSSRATPLDVELCRGDKVVYDELTALLADYGDRPGNGPSKEPGKGAVGSYGGTDHRAKYYRNPFEKLCISTGYCNPFTYGYKRRSLATDPEEQAKQEATGRSLYSTDHRAKYYRNPFEKLCISTGYCNPFSYGYRRSLRGATNIIDNNEDDKSTSCDRSTQAIKEGLSRLASQTSDDTCRSALGGEFLFECA